MNLGESSSTNKDEPQERKTKVSILGITAFILSIVSITSIFLFYHLLYIEIPEAVVVLLIALAAIIVGYIAFILNKRRQERLRGKSIALIGIAFLFISIVCLSVLVYVTQLVFLVKQKAQFFYIDGAIELFNSKFNGYPPSDAIDKDGRYYCGAMKLCEALVGRDLQGFHPSSKFGADGLDESGTFLYDPDTLGDRKGPYLPDASSNPYRLKDLYRDVGPFDGNEYVLCDIFKRNTNIDTDKKIGMPILYYKANTSKTAHDVNDPNNPENIYDYRDNRALLALGVPGRPGIKHPLYENPKIFYEMTRNTRAAGPSVPNRADTYILLSAGHDGLYGTQDDIANFEFRRRPK
jgi:hypothetical protein